MLLSEAGRWVISVAIAVVVVALVHYLARRIGQKPDDKPPKKRDHADGYPPKKRRPWHDQK
jgi:hypothetical protein